MKKLATLALLFAMLSGRALAQDAADGTKKEPTPAQLEQMKRALEAQQQQIEKLKKEAAERDKALDEMQKQVQDQLNQTQAAAASAAASARTAEAAQAQEKPGFYTASLTKVHRPDAPAAQPGDGGQHAAMGRHQDQ